MMKWPTGRVVKTTVGAIALVSASFAAGTMTSEIRASKNLEELRQSSLSTIEELQEKASEQSEKISLMESELEAVSSFYAKKLGDLTYKILVGQAKAESLFNHPFLKDNLDGYYDVKPLSDDVVANEEFGLSEKIELLIAHQEIITEKVVFAHSVINNAEIESSLFISGKPINWGWLSSKYGYRKDPFTGKKKWHSGIDLAGKTGDPIIATAAGVVVFSGNMWGYGNIVIVEHKDDYKTRYAHCSELLVSKGDLVEKGQPIALMGSTGRSTGPHVHYEVVKGHTKINPEPFIYRDGI